MAISSLAGYTANCHDYSLKFTMEDDYSDTSDLSSPPASPRPPPGFVYPTPPPSQDAEESRDQCQDLAPARKKRRVEPKERQTQILDLSPTSVLSRSEQQPQIDLLTKTILRSRKIVVVAGAGISTSAGSTYFATEFLDHS